MRSEVHVHDHIQREDERVPHVHALKGFIFTQQQHLEVLISGDVKNGYLGLSVVFPSEFGLNWFGESGLSGCMITSRCNTLLGCQTLSRSRFV